MRKFIFFLLLVAGCATTEEKPVAVAPTPSVPICVVDHHTTESIYRVGNSIYTLPWGTYRAGTARILWRNGPIAQCVLANPPPLQPAASP